MGNLAQIGGFNAGAVDQTVLNNFEPIPVGSYTALVEKSEFKRNNSNTGLIAKIEYKIIDGQYKGRALFDNFNVRHQSTKAQQIGEAQFAELCEAVNKPHIDDTSELHNIPLFVDVTIEKRKDTDQPQNVVKKRRALNSTAKPYQPRQQTPPAQTSSSPGQQQPTTQQPAPQHSGTAPWAR